MPNGKHGDNPIGDLLIHGTHPFPTDMEEMILRLPAISPGALNSLEWQPFDWEAGRDLEKGRQVLRQLLEKHGS